MNEPSSQAIGQHVEKAPFEETPNESYYSLFFKSLAQSLRIERPEYPNFHQQSPIYALAQFAENNGFRMRQVNFELDKIPYDQGPMVIIDEDQTLRLAIRKGDAYYLTDFTPNGKKREQLYRYEGIMKAAIIFYPCLTNQPLGLFDIAKFLVKYIKGDLFKTFVYHMIFGVLMLVIPVVTGVIFDDIIPNSDKIGLLNWTYLLLGMVLLKVLLDFNYMIAALRLSFKGTVLLQSAVWDRLLKLPLKFYMKFNSGDVTSRAASIDAIQQEMSSSMITIVLSSFFGLLSLVIMVVIAPVLTAGMFVLVVLLCVMYWFTMRYQLFHNRKRLEINGRLYGFLFQVFQNISKIQVFNAQRSIFHKWLKQYDDSILSLYKSENLGIYVNIASFLILTIGTALLYIYASYGKGFSSFGYFMIYNSLYTSLTSAFLSIVGVFIRLANIMAYYKRVEPILKTEPADLKQGMVLQPPFGDIELHNVYFKYDLPTPYEEALTFKEEMSEEESVTPWVLKNVNLKIRPGQFVGIVGQSGSGKSTLLKVLLGLLEIHDGSFTISNYEYTLINKKTLRQHFGLVLQNTLLFPGSILDNLLGEAFHLRDAIQPLAKAIGFEDFLFGLPMGLETVLSEGGKNLSVGQRQRLLILKALIKSPSIIVFDEATSALDNESQAKVFHYLEQNNMTRVIVTHRLSALKKADQIFVIDQGEVESAGTYDELIKRSDLFKELVHGTE